MRWSAGSFRTAVGQLCGFLLILLNVPLAADAPRPAFATQEGLASTPASAYPSAPPVQICGNTTILSGPATQPPGSVRVDPGSNLNDLTRGNPAGTTFWLSPAGTPWARRSSARSFPRTETSTWEHRAPCSTARERTGMPSPSGLFV